MSLARSNRQFFILSTAFILTGAATVTLGPLLPELRQAWQVGAAELSWLFATQFAGSALGSVLSTRHLKSALLAGYGLIGIGLLLLSLGTRPLALPALALMGFGLGNALPATNLTVAFGDPHQRGAALAKLNMIWGIGATGFPLLLAALAGHMPLRHATAALGVLCILAVLPLRWVRIPPGAAGRSADTRASTRTEHLSLVPFAAIFFFYVGSEATFGGWLVSLAGEIEATVTSREALLIGSSFWAALLIGRGVASWVLKRQSERRVFAAALIVAGTGTVLLLLASGPWMVAAGSCLGGLGLAPLYPLSVALMTRWSEKVEISDTGWVFAFAGLGGAFVPWAAGQITAAFDDTRVGFVAPAFGLITIVILFRFVIDHRS